MRTSSAPAGARLALCARDQEELVAARDKLAVRNIEASIFQTDITQQAHIDSLVRQVLDRFGRIDMLVNNAGKITVGPVDSFTHDDYDDAMNLMFWAAVNLTFAVLPYMKREGHGHVVNITSVGGRVSIPHLLPYSYAKFALAGFSTGLSAELKQESIDVFSNEFTNAFEAFTYATARYLNGCDNRIRMITPVNEISFLSWAGGDKACVNPYCTGRGHELKRQLVRAAARASEVLLNELPGVRLTSTEPVIHIVGNPDIPGDDVDAENYRCAQFQARDMLSGRLAPILGGQPEHIDILGANFYERNEWVHNTLKPLARSDPRHRITSPRYLSLSHSQSCGLGR